VNIATEQRRAEDLLQENRLYRQTALQEGDTGLASVLDELERVLLDVAHSPEQVTPCAARSDPEKDRGARDFVQSSGGQQGTAATAGGHEACAGAERCYKEREEQSMTIGNAVRKTSIAWMATAALLLSPAGMRARGLKTFPGRSAGSLQDPQEAQEKEQEKREREQEAREREDEKARAGTGSARAGPGKGRTAARVVRRRAVRTWMRTATTGRRQNSSNWRK